MKVGVPKETASGERRVALVPDSTKRLAEAGVEVLVESGLTPLQAITAATQTSAASLRRPTDLGTIEAGKLADLIVLGQDPSRDIHAIRTVQRVMSGGAWVDVARYRTW